MADAKRQPNRHPSPDTTNRGSQPTREPRSPDETSAQDSSKMPLQAPAMAGPATANTPEVQRRVEPTRPGEFPEGGDAAKGGTDPVGEEGAESAEKQDEQQTSTDPAVRDGTGPAPATSDGPEGETPVQKSQRIQRERMEAGNEAERITPIQQSIPSGAQPPAGMPQVDQRTDERSQRRSVLDHSLPAGLGGGFRAGGPEGFDKLRALYEAMPDDTPDEHILFGYGGYKVTVRDLGMVVGDPELE